MKKTNTGVRGRVTVTHVSVVSEGFVEEVTQKLRSRDREIHHCKDQAAGEYTQKTKAAKVLFDSKNL